MFLNYTFLIILLLGKLNAIPEKPCNENNQGEYIADDDKCDSYFGCLMSNWYSFTCPIGLEFNPLKNVCDRPIDGGCKQWTSEATTETTTSIETSTVTSTTEAPTTTQSTTISTEASTTTESQPETTSEISTTVESSTTTEIPETTTGGSSNICSNLEGNFIPHPDDCAQFYFCENGEPLIFKCGIGLLFDAKLLKCVKEGEASCFE